MYSQNRQIPLFFALDLRFIAVKLSVDTNDALSQPGGRVGQGPISQPRAGQVAGISNNLN